MYGSSDAPGTNVPRFDIDFRSDTVTKPTPEMLDAMSRARVGDDVLGDDPTVRELELKVANFTGKSAAAFFPSGTQSNLAGIMAHCERGDEYIVGQDAHTYRFEGGGAAVLGSIQPQPIENEQDGTLPLRKIAAAIKPGDSHYARSRLIALENTISGKVLPEAYVNDVAALAREKGLSLHLDGARAWHVMVAQQRSMASVCAPFGTVSLCFSKGLGAPVGSVLVGDGELVTKARRWRKVLGGGLRQSGYLAAACIYALENNVERLADDHANAARLAEGLSAVLPGQVRYTGTNMVFVSATEELNTHALAEHLRRDGIGVTPGQTLRLVCHLGVTRRCVDRIIESAATFGKAVAA